MKGSNYSDCSDFFSSEYEAPVIRYKIINFQNIMNHKNVKIEKTRNRRPNSDLTWLIFWKFKRSKNQMHGLHNAKEIVHRCIRAYRWLEESDLDPFFFLGKWKIRFLSPRPREDRGGSLSVTWLIDWLNAYPHALVRCSCVRDCAIYSTTGAEPCFPAKVYIAF